MLYLRLKTKGFIYTIWARMSDCGVGIYRTFINRIWRFLNMIKLILEEYIFSKSGWLVWYFDVKGSKYINTIKVRGDKNYQRGDIFNAI